MTSKISGPQLVQYKDEVVKNFDESNWKELGALTNMIDEVEKHDRLLRSLSWRDPDYEGHVLTFLRKMIGPNDENLHIVQNYLEKVCGSVGENISSVSHEGRKIVFTPNIFSVPNESVDPKLISVMMPFQKEFLQVYETIKQASISVGFTCMRVDDIWDHSTVIQDIFSLIFRSYIVVCDFTGKNPNVFYEAGIAHTLGKYVVPITQSEQDIPFDLQHHRYAKYLNNNEGLTNLNQELKIRFTTLAQKRMFSN